MRLPRARIVNGHLMSEPSLDPPEDPPEGNPIEDYNDFDDYDDEELGDFIDHINNMEEAMVQRRG